MRAGTVETPLAERWELKELRPCDVADWRGRVRDELAKRGYASDDAVLVVSELLTNVITHASASAALWLEIREGELFIGVSDRSTLRPTAGLPDWKSLHGRGLFLVEQLATSWDVLAARNGKLVYALLPLRSADDKDSSWGLTQ